MPWTFVRPRDGSLLRDRPLLDIGTGDGQTLEAVAPGGVGLDRTFGLLRSGAVCGDALALPFRDASFAAVLAADLVHHIADLDSLFAEIARVLRPAGVFVAWWYAQAPHDAPDAPRFPRTYEEVAEHTARFAVEPLDLEINLGGGPPTVGLVGRL